MSSTTRRHLRLLAPLGFAAVGAGLALLGAGPLNPPAGTVAPSYKTLAEVEPRIAINATNTPGDANSRFRITQPGSYYLTGNLTGVAGDHGVEIAASNVTIDLMGFAVTGAALSADGITTDGLRDHITIRNGTITGWGSDGINLTTGGIGTGARIEDVTASGNGANGFRLGNRAIVRSCMALSNGADGFNANSNSIMSGCVASLNVARGFTVSSGSTLTQCTASNNTTDGFFIVGNAIATQCTSIGNDGRGFYVGTSGVVNQCIATSNGSHGIELTSRSIASNNAVNGNTNAAVTAAGILSTGDSNKVQFNHCVANSVGIHVTGGSETIVADNTSQYSTNGIVEFKYSGPVNPERPVVYRNFVKNADGGNPFDFGGLPYGLAPVGNLDSSAGGAPWSIATGAEEHPWANFRH